MFPPHPEMSVSSIHWNCSHCGECHPLLAFSICGFCLILQHRQLQGCTLILFISHSTHNFLFWIHDWLYILITVISIFLTPLLSLISSIFNYPFRIFQTSQLDYAQLTACFLLATLVYSSSFIFCFSHWYLQSFTQMPKEEISELSLNLLPNQVSRSLLDFPLSGLFSPV